MNCFLPNLLKEIIRSLSSFLQCRHVKITKKHFQNLAACPVTFIFVVCFAVHLLKKQTFIEFLAYAKHLGFRKSKPQFLPSRTW